MIKAVRELVQNKDVEFKCTYCKAREFNIKSDENQTKLPPVMRGWRRVGRIQTNKFTLVNDYGESWLDIPRKALVDCEKVMDENDYGYDVWVLRTYLAGYRDLNAEEKMIKRGWEKIMEDPRMQKLYEDDVYTDGSQTYYMEKRYFADHNAEYLMGFEQQKGMIFDFNNRLIRDENVKGDLELEYIVRKIQK